MRYPGGIFSLSLLLLLSLFLLGSCGTDDPVEADPLPCDEARDAARTSLENTLYDTFEGPDPEEPRDVDFSTCRGLYQDLLDCDATDLNAHFALAVLDLVDLSTDDDVNQAFDDWEAYLDEMLPFEVEVPTKSLAIPDGLTGEGAMELPFDSIRRSLVPYLNLKKAVAPPQIADVQAIFRDKVLPRALSGIGHMNEVLGDRAFTFAITPKMQGDLLEETRVADYTDFLALRAGLNALAAGLRIAISYNLNMAEYTGVVLATGLEQGSGELLTLRDGDAAPMLAAIDNLGAAADGLDAAIDALIAETDDQYDDVIKIGPDDLDRDDLLDFQATELQMIIDSLAGPAIHTYDWDGRNGTPDVAMTVDVHGFFSPPVADFKALLPPYTVSLDIVPHDRDYYSFNEYEDITVAVPETTTCYIDCMVWYNHYVVESSYCDAPSWAESAVQDLIDAKTERFMQDDEWDGYGEVHVGYFRSLGEGIRTISVHVTTTYSVTNWVEVAIVTFEADTYAEWLSQWPDPTLNGLFPEVTTASQVTEAFGMDEDEWSKEFSLDWADGGFGFDDGWTDPWNP